MCRAARPKSVSTIGHPSDISDRIAEYGLSCDVGVDVWDWQPVPWEVLSRRMEDAARNIEFAPSTPRGDLQARVQELRDRNMRFLRG